MFCFLSLLFSYPSYLRRTWGSPSSLSYYSYQSPVVLVLPPPLPFPPTRDTWSPTLGSPMGWSDYRPWWGLLPFSFTVHCCMWPNLLLKVWVSPVMVTAYWNSLDLQSHDCSLSILASKGCCNRTPQIGWLKVREICCLTALEARSPKSKC